MVGTFVVQVVAVIAIAIVVAALVCILLWRLKSAEDRKAFSRVLNNDSVVTTRSPEEYLKEQARRNRLCEK